jgi:hypothetical protein
MERMVELMLLLNTLTRLKSADLVGWLQDTEFGVPNLYSIRKMFSIWHGLADLTLLAKLVLLAPARQSHCQN